MCGFSPRCRTCGCAGWFRRALMQVETWQYLPANRKDSGKIFLTVSDSVKNRFLNLFNISEDKVAISTVFRLGGKFCFMTPLYLWSCKWQRGRFIWTLHWNGILRVKSMYGALTLTQILSFVMVIWKIKVPKKICLVFVRCCFDKKIILLQEMEKVYFHSLTVTKV